MAAKIRSLADTVVAMRPMVSGGGFHSRSIQAHWIVSEDNFKDFQRKPLRFVTNLTVSRPNPFAPLREILKMMIYPRPRSLNFAERTGDTEGGM